MWAHSHDSGWAGLEAMDYGSPMANASISGSEISMSPTSGMMQQYPASLAASTLPFAEAAAHACHFAPALEAQVHGISSRVQKLERSRGQITKDLADMLNETRELQKRVGLAGPKEAQVSAKAYDTDSILQVSHWDGESLPPGLGRRQSRLKTAPATLPQVPEGIEDQPLIAKSQTEKILPPPGLILPESLTVKMKDFDGVEISRVEWRIDNVKAKFKDCVGRPLVSPEFKAAGLQDLRLMVFPNLGLDAAGLTMREQKTHYEARIAEGPLSGALKFKVVTQVGDQLVIKFNLFVGEILKGPIEHNFADHVIHGLDFSNNWLEQVGNGALVVGVEVLTVNGKGALAAATAAIWADSEKATSPS